MQDFSRPDRIFLLQQGGQRYTEYYTVSSCGCSGMYSSGPMVQHTIVYNFDYDQHNHCCGHNHAQKKEPKLTGFTAVATAISEITRGTCNGVATIIKTCADLDDDESAVSTNTTTTSSSSNGVSSANAGEESASVVEESKKSISEQLADLNKDIQALNESLEKPVPDSSTPTVGASEDSSDFAKKWNKVDISYKDECGAYVIAVKDNNAEKIAEYKPQLNDILNKVSAGKEEIQEYLKGDNISDEDKKIANRALKTLEGIEVYVNQSLKAKPEVVETPQSSSVDKVDNTSEVSQSSSVSDNKKSEKKSAITSAREAASAANTKFGKTKTLFDQRAAITAYNKWADAVLNPANNASDNEVAECYNSLDFMCANNTGAGVKDLISTSKILKGKLAREQYSRLRGDMVSSPGIIV